MLRGHVESSEIYIEWATWLHSRGADVNDKLTTAADTLLEIERENFSDNMSLSSSTSSRLSSKLSGKSLKSATSLHQKTSRSKLTSHDEVDGNPDKLNITHYERLIRIYMMLGELAQNSHRRKHYLLQAFTWLKRILESITGPLSKNKNEWLDYEIPDDLIQDMLKEEIRDKFCKFAFDKPNLTHHFLRIMCNWLDEIYIYHHECLVVLTFLKAFSKIVLQNELLEDVYKSWKIRIFKKMAIEKDKFVINFEKVDDKDRDYLGEELYKREEYMDSENVLRPSKTIKSQSLLANIAFILGRGKQSVKISQAVLKSKSIESFETIPDTACHLNSINKFTDAQTMLVTTIESLQDKNSLSIV